MNFFKNGLQVNQNRSLDLPDTSTLSAPVNSSLRQLSNSVHDLRSLDGAQRSTEMDISSNRRALYRARKNRRLDDNALLRPHSVSDQQCLKNSSSDSMTDGPSPSKNRLSVPLNLGVNSTMSRTRSNSSHCSMECLDGSSIKPPESLQGVLLKSRKWPMKGWHERFFVLSNGCLSYAKNQSLLARGRNKTQIDLANTFVSSEPDKLQITINATAVVYHLKFEDSAKFRQWLTAIKEHRSYDQYQTAITSSARPNANPNVSTTALNLSGEGTSCNNNFTTSLSTPDVGQVLMRPSNLNRVSGPWAGQTKGNKQTNRLSNEHITAMEKLIGKLENVYQELARAQSLVLESNILKNDCSEAENSSPSRSVFFSPEPFITLESQSSSTVRGHRRLSSVSSTTSMYTAVQGPATEAVDLKSINQNQDFVRAVVKFSDEAKRFIEEANEALATMQQMNQLCNSRLTPNKERNPIPLTIIRTPSGGIETDSDSESSGVENSGDSQSDDIPLLNESKMNVPDMKGVALKNPEPVAGRRTALPARQSSPPTFSLLALLRSNIGRDLTKMRLPAILNEPLSVLQNLCEEMEYSQLLDAAVEMKDPMQRMLYVVTFAISGYASTATRTATKSFAPLLGETFECIRPEKQWRFLAEQVSNSPPTATAHCESKLWVFDQEFGIKYKFWGKTLEINATGGCHLYFPRWQETYTWNKVTTSVTNLVSPTGRTLDHAGDMMVECSNRVTSSIHFSKSDTRRQDTYRSVRGTVQPPPGSAEPQRPIYGRWDKILVSKDENNDDRCIWRANPLPSHSSYYYGFTQFAIELNEPPAPDAVSSGRLPITDTRLRPDIRLLELGRVEDAEADNKRIEDEQRRRLKLYSSRDVEGNNPCKPLWFSQKTKPLQADRHGTLYEFNPAYWRYRESGGFKDLKLPILCLIITSTTTRHSSLVNVVTSSLSS
ncbi:oxysterol binding protein 3 [Echinococcus multilocularis]|uniref:Oxysterol binding protein 3 n=1 Tax=Echinococcus multilocularis TaxID=6211 RepID=A0A068Y2C3_ECHMU|nr:oxysterol binding protein 3 [Echinococcus multilocularis]